MVQTLQIVRQVVPQLEKAKTLWFMEHTFGIVRSSEMIFFSRGCQHTKVQTLKTIFSPRNIFRMTLLRTSKMHLKFGIW